MNAQMVLGTTSFYMGELLHAREHLEMGISLYDPKRHRPLAFRYGVDAEVGCRSFAAWTLWQLGHPDQALRRGNEALALAQALFQPFGLAFAEYFVGSILRQSRREARAAQETADGVIALSTEHGFTQFWLGRPACAAGR